MFQQKELLIFPIVTLVLTGCIAMFFFSPVIVLFVAHGFGAGGPQAFGNWLHANPAAGLYFIVTYFVSMVCATFFNVAFYHEIIEALQGRPVSIVNGLRFACTRWKSILLWSAFAGLMGYIIRALEEKFGLFGRIIMGLVGMAWSVACVFVIPVIIMDETTSNPVSMLKKSVLTLKQTWGESLIGYVGISFGRLLVMIGSLLWLGGAIAAAVMLHSFVLGAMAVAGWLAAIIVFGYFTSVANQIFRCALFLYASTGAMPLPFHDDMAALAWKLKKS
jgi:hypothetical protein